MKTHVLLVHERDTRYKCSFEGCDKGFPYKSIRDHHEKSHQVMLIAYVQMKTNCIVITENTSFTKACPWARKDHYGSNHWKQLCWWRLQAINTLSVWQLQLYVYSQIWFGATSSKHSPSGWFDKEEEEDTGRHDGPRQWIMTRNTQCIY